jgi:histidine ammonia-lyase
MVVLDGDHLSIEEVIAVAAGADTVSLAPQSIEKMLRSRAVVERLAAADAPVYGVNTGVGLLADVRVPQADLEQLQRNVIRSHAAGVGDPLGRDEVRAMMLIRANVLAKGFRESGRWWRSACARCWHMASHQWCRRRAAWARRAISRRWRTWRWC